VGRIDCALVARDADGSARRARHRMAFETEFFNNAQDSLDLTIGRVVLHYD
jgi:hypothetical protein